MTNPTPPATGADIEALADSLSASADALHARLMRAIRRRTPDDPAGQGLSQADAQTLFDNEVALRQRANGLYLDAALLAAAGLAGRQRQLLELAARARKTIGTIDRLRDLVDLTGELLTLAAAVAAGKPEHIAAPFEQIRHHLDALRGD